MYVIVRDDAQSNRSDPPSVRLPNSEHEAHRWRIREIAPDFELEDVWALPVHGGPGDFPELLEMMGAAVPDGGASPAARVLWRVREQVGRVLGWDEVGDVLPIPGTVEASLRERLPADLRGTATEPSFGSLPFVPVYRTDDEFAAELSNRTVHGVLHLAWVQDGQGRYQGQMAIYVKPRGRLGDAYMALIRPFRHAIVYPAMMRQLERAWSARIAARVGSASPH
jgi:hypothetical protein